MRQHNNDPVNNVPDDDADDDDDDTAQREDKAISLCDLWTRLQLDRQPVGGGGWA